MPTPATVQKKSPRSKRSVFGGTTSGGRSGLASKLTSLKQGPSSGNLADINQGLAIGSTPGKMGLTKPLFAGLTSPGSSQPQILLEEENFRLGSHNIGPLQMLSPLHELEGPALRVKFSPRGDNSDLGNSALGIAQGMEDVRGSVAVSKGSKRLDMPSSLMGNKSRRSRAHTIMNSL